MEEWFRSLNKYYMSLNSRTDDELEFIYNLLYNSRIEYLKKEKNTKQKVNILWITFCEVIHKYVNKFNIILEDNKDMLTYQSVLKSTSNAKSVSKSVSNNLHVIKNMKCKINNSLFKCLDAMKQNDSLIIRIKLPIHTIHQLSMLYLLYNCFKTIKIYKSFTVFNEYSYIICDGLYGTVDKNNYKKGQVVEKIPEIFTYEIDRIMNLYTREIITDISKILNFIDDKESFEKINKKYLKSIIIKKNKKWIKKYL
jgi:hypothetical protein